jgi:hypothetical protein
LVVEGPLNSLLHPNKVTVQWSSSLHDINRPWVRIPRQARSLQPLPALAVGEILEAFLLRRRRRRRRKRRRECYEEQKKENEREIVSGVFKVILEGGEL